MRRLIFASLRKRLSFGLATAILLCTSPSHPRAQSGCDGQQIAPPYKGVVAFSNGPEPYSSCGPYGTYGWEFQCVEYARRFYAVALGVNTSKANGWGGHAKDYFGSAAQKGLLSFSNGVSTTPPQPDDILVFGGSSTNQYGHVAVVTGVQAGNVSVIEQNWSSSTGTASLPISQDSGTGSWTMPSRSGLPVLGWLRDPSSVPPGPLVTFTSVTGTSPGSGLEVEVSLDVPDDPELVDDWWELLMTSFDVSGSVTAIVQFISPASFPGQNGALWVTQATGVGGPWRVTVRLRHADGGNNQRGSKRCDNPVLPCAGFQPTPLLGTIVNTENREIVINP